jgi:hypothetical protein
MIGLRREGRAESALLIEAGVEPERKPEDEMPEETGELGTDDAEGGEQIETIVDKVVAAPAKV